jgi:pyruvate/oxaloacetate carboxyltransferase
MAKVGITETVLRDAHQSLLATRMRIDDMLPIVEQLDEVGYYSLEVWGGATFDSALRFLKEDPWERLRLIKARTKTPLQMLLRGQNCVGYRHYADDVVEKFCHKAAENGVDIFRIFDAVNDLRNLETAIRAVREAGAHAQGTICYTTSPVHTPELYAAQAKQLDEMGCHSICLKDMAGLLSAYDAYTIISKIREVSSLPIAMHCHDTCDQAEMAYLKGIEAGATSIDCAMSALAGGTSQPATETMVHQLRGTEWDTGLDMGKLFTINEYFKKVRPKYAQFEGHLLGIDAGVLLHQVPGGMISNLVNQLREQNALDKLQDVFEENARVRADMGYPPLVTPTSQIVGTQAVMNVLMGERYKAIPSEVKQYVRGFYGQPPAEISAELKQKAIGEETPIKDRPADHIEPEWEKAKAEAGPLAQSEEDVLSYVMFPPVAKEFFEWRAAGGGPDRSVVAAIAAALTVKPRAHHAPEQDGHRPPANHWKTAGRQRQLARR